MAETYYIFIDKITKKIRSFQKVQMIDNNIGIFIDNYTNILQLKYQSKDENYLETKFFEKYKLNIWEHIYKFQYIGDLNNYQIDSMIPIQTLKIEVKDDNNNIIYTEKNLDDVILVKPIKIDLNTNKKYSIEISIYDKGRFLDTIIYYDSNELDFRIYDENELSTIEKISENKYIVSSTVPLVSEYKLFEENTNYFYGRRLKIRFTNSQV